MQFDLIQQQAINCCSLQYGLLVRYILPVVAATEMRLIQNLIRFAGMERASEFS